MDYPTKEYKTSDFSANNNLTSAANLRPPHVNSQIAEIEELSLRIKEAKIPVELAEKTEKMIDRLRKMAQQGSYSGEYELIEKYVDIVASIPFHSKTEDNLDIENVIKVLDSHHFGLQPVKDKIIECLAVMKLRKQMDVQNGVTNAQPDPKEPLDMAKLTGNSSHAPVLCFVGVQGIGKTSIAKSIAQATGRHFVRVALGAMGSVVQIRGQSRAFMGAEPGQIIKAMIRAKVTNPLILLDEIDKVSGEESRRFDFMAALLEILDPEQNGTFTDAYVDYPIDLSQVMFICTANTLGTLSAALLDRLDIIRFSSYSDEEKAYIAKDYLLPKVREATGLTEAQLSFAPGIWPLLIRPLGFDAGIRQLERNLTTVARKAARLIVEGKIQSVEISAANFREYIPDDIGIFS